MKLGILCDEIFDPKVANGYGGFGFLTKTLLEELNKKGICSYVLIPTKKFTATHSEYIIPIYIPDTSNKVIRQYLIGRELLTCIGEYEIDTLLSIEVPLSAIVSMIFAKKIKKKITWLQDPRDKRDWQIIQRDMYGKAECSRSKLYAYRFLNMMFGIIAKPQYWTQARYLINKGREIYGIPEHTKIELVYNPVEIPAQNTIMKSKKPMILFLGRLDPIKRPVLFFKLAIQNPNLDFIVAGDTQDVKLRDSYYKNFGKIKNLNFLGHVSGDTKKEILSKSWILINTSIHEALPISFLEALAYKIPIISTQDPENITSKFGVYIHNVSINSVLEEDQLVRDFSVAIQKLINDPMLRISKGNHGYEYVKNNHAKDKQILLILRKLQE